MSTTTTTTTTAFNAIHVLGQRGQRHNVEAEFERNQNARGKLKKLFVYCPNVSCKHHLSIDLSSKALLVKCSVCMTVFNPYSNTIIQCKRCKTRNAVPLWVQIMQCSNRQCKAIINCWPVFRIERYRQMRPRTAPNPANIISLEEDEEGNDDAINIETEDDDLMMIMDSSNTLQLEQQQSEKTEEEHKLKLKSAAATAATNNLKHEMDDDDDDDVNAATDAGAFLMVKESDIGAWTKYKQKKYKLQNEEKLIRMENSDGLVVVINDSQKFKAKQHHIKEPKAFKSAFEWYHTINLVEWQQKHPNDSHLQLLTKINRFWKTTETEKQKEVYRKIAADDQRRYEQEMKVWHGVAWMNKVSYDE